MEKNKGLNGLKRVEGILYFNASLQWKGSNVAQHVQIIATRWLSQNASRKRETAYVVKLEDNTYISLPIFLLSPVHIHAAWVKAGRLSI